jgi:hypothetical protein
MLSRTLAVLGLLAMLTRLSHLKRSSGEGAGEFRLLSTRVLKKQAR